MLGDWRSFVISQRVSFPLNASRLLEPLLAPHWKGLTLPPAGRSLRPCDSAQVFPAHGCAVGEGGIPSSVFSFFFGSLCLFLFCFPLSLHPVSQVSTVLGIMGMGCGRWTLVQRVVTEPHHRGELKRHASHLQKWKVICSFMTANLQCSRKI